MIGSEGGQYIQGMSYDYEFYPVTSGSEENKKFYASTPTGSLKITTSRIDQFVPGKEYYLDIISAGAGA